MVVKYRDCSFAIVSSRYTGERHSYSRARYHALITSDDAPVLERSRHRHCLALQIKKVNFRRKFFAVPLRQMRTELKGRGCRRPGR